MPIGSICVVNPAYQLSVLISKKIVFLVFLVVNPKRARMPNCIYSIYCFPFSPSAVYVRCFGPRLAWNLRKWDLLSNFVMEKQDINFYGR